MVGEFILFYGDKIIRGSKAEEQICIALVISSEHNKKLNCSKFVPKNCGRQKTFNALSTRLIGTL